MEDIPSVQNVSIQPYDESFNNIIQEIEKERSKDNTKTTQIILENLITVDQELQETFKQLLETMNEDGLEGELNKLAYQLYQLQSKILLINCSKLLKDSPKPSIKRLIRGLTNKIIAMNQLIDEKNILL